MSIVPWVVCIAGLLFLNDLVVCLGLFGGGGDGANGWWCEFWVICWGAGSVASVARFYVAEAHQGSQAGSANKRPEQEPIVLKIQEKASSQGSHDGADGEALGKQRHR